MPALRLYYTAPCIMQRPYLQGYNYIHIYYIFLLYLYNYHQIFYRPYDKGFFKFLFKNANCQFLLKNTCMKNTHTNENYVISNKNDNEKSFSSRSI
jgi:hypothetical protein